jgi:hypothetical protein
MKGHTPAREAEELRRVAEIVLGRALEGRDSPTSLGRAERAKSSPAQAGQTAGKFSLTSGDVMKVTGRAIDIAQDAYRDAVAQMQRLTGRQDAEAEADAIAIAGKAPAEEAERKAPEQNLAAVAAPRREESRRTGQEERAGQEEKAPPKAAREVPEAQARAAAQDAGKRQMAEDPCLEAGETARKAAEEKPRSDAEAKEQAEGAEADLAHARVHPQELEPQPSIRQTDQKLPPPAPRNLDSACLMEQARLLLDQGDIIAARRVLEGAAESGHALALFLLAETYDPASLSAWGIFSRLGLFGRLGDVTKARELYAKAAARGIHAAKYRLSLLR